MTKSVPTLETVALRAGVSRQTVSNALHRPERLATATRDRVLVAVRETGYRPSLPARQLATRRSHAVAVRADRPQDGISGLVLDAFFHGLAEAGERSGHRVVLYAAQDDQSTELAVLEDLLGSAAADAVVLTGTDRDDSRPAALSSAGLTFCSFGRPWAEGEPPHDWVDVDGALGTALAVEHLLATGHRRIAFLGWPGQSPTGEDRRAGWLRAVRAAGDAGSAVEGRSDNDAHAAQVAVESMLTSADPPDAVVCASDTLAFGAHRAARALDHPLGIVGFDATPVATALGFASVAQPVREAAHTCMDLLLPRLRGEQPAPRGVLLLPRLLVPAP
jgi:DNA-binding LacI/PurR family transcriptional regulator